MHIRQETLFSFKEILNFQKQTRLELICSQLNISKISTALGKSRYSRGPKGYYGTAMLYALLAIQIEGIPKVNA